MKAIHKFDELKLGFNHGIKTYLFPLNFLLFSRFKFLALEQRRILF